MSAQSPQGEPNPGIQSSTQDVQAAHERAANTVDGLNRTGLPINADQTRDLFADVTAVLGHLLGRDQGAGAPGAASGEAAPVGATAAQLGDLSDRIAKVEDELARFHNRVVALEGGPDSPASAGLDVRPLPGQGDASPAVDHSPAPDKGEPSGLGAPGAPVV